MRLAAGLGLLALAVSAALAPAARADADPAAPIHFYRAQGAGGRPVFFYPSFHLRDSRVPRPPLAMLDRVKRLVLEADIAAAKAHPEMLSRYLLSPAPLDLVSLFTPEEVAAIRSHAACNGVGAMIEKLRLSFIATITAMPCPKAGGGSYEEEVERAAQERGLEIVALESAEEEFGALAALPDRVFIDEIKELAAEADAGERMIDKMIGLYNAGDFDGLFDLATRNGMENAADRKLFVDKVLLERNRRMVQRLGGVLARGDALVVVGALHFPGKGGILDLLRRQGVAVTAIDVRDGALR